jgi:hypothetical protein
MAAARALPLFFFFPSPDSIRFLAGFWDGAPRLPLSSGTLLGWVSRSILAGKVERESSLWDPCYVVIFKRRLILNQLLNLFF